MKSLKTITSTSENNSYNFSPQDTKDGSSSTLRYEKSLEEEYDDEIHYIEVLMNENNKDFYNQNILNELGVNAEISIIFKTNEYKTEKEIIGGGEPVYEQITIPYRYFYSGLKTVSNLFVFSKNVNLPSKATTNESSSTIRSQESLKQSKLSTFFSYFSTKGTKNGLPSQATAKESSSTLRSTENVNNSLPQPIIRPEEPKKPSIFDTVSKTFFSNKNNLPSQSTENKSSSTLPPVESLKPDENTPTEEPPKIRIKLIGKIQDFDYSYSELLQERLWIEKALSLNLYFLEYKLYKINNKIILIGELESIFSLNNETPQLPSKVTENESASTLLSVESYVSENIKKRDFSEIQRKINEVRIYEFKRFNSLYPGVLSRIENTELYKKILYGVN